MMIRQLKKIGSAFMCLSMISSIIPIWNYPYATVIEGDVDDSNDLDDTSGEISGTNDDAEITDDLGNEEEDFSEGGGIFVTEDIYTETSENAPTDLSDDDVIEDVILEDDYIENEINAFSDEYTISERSYEARFTYHHPGRPASTEYGTFEEMWTRCYEEGVGMVTLLRDVTASVPMYDAGANGGYTIYGFGNGSAFTNEGAIRIPGHRYNDETTDYEWPTLNLNGYTLSGGKKPLFVQFDAGRIVYCASGCWGVILGGANEPEKWGTIEHSSKSAVYMDTNQNYKNNPARMGIWNTNFKECWSKKGGAIYMNGGSLLSCGNIKITDCGVWDDGGAIYAENSFIDISQSVTINNNNVIEADEYSNEDLPSRIYEDNNLSLVGSTKPQFLLKGTNGEISLHTNNSIGSTVATLSSDALFNHDVTVKSDWIDYAVHRTSGSKSFTWGLPNNSATAPCYWKPNDSSSDTFYGSVQQVWDYACDKGYGVVTMTQTIRKNFKSGKYVFGTGENFTEDGSFLWKNKSGDGTISEIKVIVLEQINAYDEGGIFVVDGSDGPASLTIEGTDVFKGISQQQLRTEAGVLLNTSESAVIVRGEDAHASIKRIGFYNCTGSFGAGICVDGGTLDIWKVQMDSCIASEVGGAIYCNSFVERNITLGDGTSHAYTGMYIEKECIIRSNYRQCIDQDGNPYRISDNIYLASGNVMAWDNAGLKIRVNVDSADSLPAEIVVGITGDESSWTWELGVDNSEKSYVRTQQEDDVFKGGKYLYLMEKFEANASLSGWDMFDAYGTVSEVWEWVRQQSEPVYFQTYNNLTANSSNGFGKGEGFSKTGEFIVTEGMDVYWNIGNSIVDRNAGNRSATDTGYSIAVIKNGGSLHIKGYATGYFMNAASSAFRVEQGGILETMSSISITNCRAIRGGAIYNQGTVILNDTADAGIIIKNNSAVREGGGIWNDGDIVLYDSGVHTITNNTSRSNARKRDDNIYLTDGHYITAAGEYKNNECAIGLRSEAADNDVPAIAILNGMSTWNAPIETLQQTFKQDNALLQEIVADGNDLVFNLKHTSKDADSPNIECYVFDGLVWNGVGIIYDGLIMRYVENIGYLFYVDINKAAEVFGEWGFNPETYDPLEISFFTEEDDEDMTWTITNTFPSYTENGITYIPAGIVTEFNYSGNSLRLYFTNSKRENNHRDFEAEAPEYFRPDGRVQITIMDKNGNTEKESYGLDVYYTKTLKWDGGYEWTVFYTNGMLLNKDNLKIEYDGFDINISLNKVDYSLMIRESQSKRSFNVLLRASVDYGITEFGRIPEAEVLGPALFNGEGRFYIKASSFDKYLKNFGYDSREFNGEPIFGYKLKGMNEIIPLKAARLSDDSTGEIEGTEGDAEEGDVWEGELGGDSTEEDAEGDAEEGVGEDSEEVVDGREWVFVLPSMDGNPYGFDDGKIYLLSRESNEVHYLDDTYIEESDPLPDEISFYSVRIDDIVGRNDWHCTDVSQTYYIPTNTPFDITLPSRTGHAWDADIVHESRLAALGTFTVIKIQNVNKPVVISNSISVDINYSVQYYGSLEQFVFYMPNDPEYDKDVTGNRWNTRKINGHLDLIDTSNQGDGTGGIMPNNSYSHDTARTRQVHMNRFNNKIQTEINFCPLSKSSSFDYNATPTLAKAMQAYDSNNYEITELWVLKNADDIRAEMKQSGISTTSLNDEFEDEIADAEESVDDDSDLENVETDTEEEEDAVGGDIEGNEGEEEIGGDLEEGDYPEYNPDNNEGNGNEDEPHEPQIDVNLPSPDSTNPNDWNIYTLDDLGVSDFKYVKLVHINTEGKAGYLQIRDGDVIRFIYNPLTDSIKSNVKFYDYDLSDGYWYTTASDAKSGTNRNNTQGIKYGNYWNVTQNGINSLINYKNNRLKLFGFGNANTGTAIQDEQFIDTSIKPSAKIYFNRANLLGSNITACGLAFGLVQGLDENGNIIYNPQINAPNLFDEGAAIGKTPVNNYKLVFDRTGDVFTLKSVLDDTESIVLDNLDTLKQPGTNYHVWTNEFWPMDKAPSAGTNGHDPLFGINADMRNINGTTTPPSDCGERHNSYFGMHYEISFRLQKDYVGPMQYVFFGDDDLWIFLDGELVMDLGGVHSSVGGYLDLWDYIKHGDDSQHTLSVYYTERGSSGSTCYMSFIIPNAKFMDLGLSNTTGALYVEKHADVPFDNDMEYNFNLKLKNKDGSFVTDAQKYAKYNKNGSLIDEGYFSDGEFNFILKDDEAMLFPSVPKETLYEMNEEPIIKMDTWITELGKEPIHSTYISGMVEAMSVIELEYENIWHDEYEETGRLPDTGGNTYYGWIIGLGMLLIGSTIFRKKYND